MDDFQSLLNCHRSGNPEAAFSYFYDDRIPVPANLRRQRQYVSEPVVLPTTRFAPQTRQEEVKTLPNRPDRPHARPGYFFSPVSHAVQQPFVFPPPPPPPQTHSSSLFQQQQQQQQQQQSFQHHQLQLFEQQRQQQILEQQRQQRQLVEEQQQQVHAQPQPPQLLVQEQPPPPASASSASVVPTPEQSPQQQQQQQQQPSLSPFRLQDAVTTTTSTLLFPTTSFARGTHLKPVPAVPPRLTLTTDPEEQRSAPPTTESSFAQIRFGAQPSGPTARPVVPAAGAAAAEPFSRPVVNVRSRQTTLSAARPVTAPPTVATAAETAAASEGKETKTVKRVRKPVRKVRKLKPVVHIVPVSTAAPLPSSSEHVPTAPTVAPTAASRSQATGFRALRPRPFKGITGLRGRLHHGNSDNKLR